MASRRLRLSRDKAELLALLFHPSFYRRCRPGFRGDDLDLFRSFIEEGLHGNERPGPFFDPEWCAAKLGLLRKGNGKADLPPAMVLRWLESEADRRVPPTPLFDRDHYLATYQDVRRAEVDPFWHFLKYGDNEGRLPRPVARNGWMARVVRERNLRSPTPFRDLLSRFPTARLEAAFQDETWKRAWRYFMPAFYRMQQDELPEDVSDEALFLHFHAAGIDAGRRPTLLFNARFYRDRLARLKEEEGADRLEPGVLEIEPHVSPWFHWLTIGVDRRIVPTPLFDAEHYLATHRDLHAWRRWIFDHFALHGCKEAMRVPSPFFSNRHYVNLHAPLKHEIIYLDCLLRGAEGIRSLHPRLFPDVARLMPPVEEEGEETVLERIFLSLGSRQEFLHRPVVRQMVEKARGLEPLVAKPDGPRKISWVPRIHDKSGLLFHGPKLPRYVGMEPLDTLVLLPHLRQLSGASKVGALVAHAIRKAFPDQRLLVVLTDVHQPEPPSWLPEGLNIFDFARHFPREGLAPESRLALLLDIITGTRARRVVNVNSRLAWDLFMNHGQQLSRYTRLYAYLFCWDKDRHGNRVGYPVRELPACMNFLSGVFCDTKWLCDEIADRFLLPPRWRKRLHVLYTPAEEPVGDFSAQLRRPRPTTGRRYRALWAGRLDRQKRPDVVMEIARLMPELEIVMYGREVLGGSGVDFSKRPENVIIRDPVAGLADMQPETFDFYLYTSEWDGLPNVIITAGINAFPTVYAITGGIGELLTEETGWPVHDPLDPVAYVRRIREMLASPEEAERRAKAFRRRTQEMCNERSYLEAVRRIFLEEEGEDETGHWQEGSASAADGR